MNIFINNHKITIFNGAAAGDAVLAYSERSYKQVLHGNLVIVDIHGNKTEPDGPVIEGQSFFLKKKKQTDN
jgi:hypothetical protein